MKLKFKIQQYQTDAVESTVGVFNGQPNQGLAEYKVEKGKVYKAIKGKRIEQKGLLDDLEINGYRNGAVELSEQQLLDNIRHIQTVNNINLSSEVAKRLGACQLDIEMETGTGKTYVYIKTMFELNKRYGWTKFIVVVPSIAIREGVKKSFDITQDHFMELYGKKVRPFIYNSDALRMIDSFSQSADINVMIINTQAFNTSLKEGASNKAARIIYDKRDEFGSRRPIDVIAANNPIIILDEPQKMGGAATQRALEGFKPLFTLNYSATHKESHNPIYVLDALDAYNKKLVKKIEVMGFELKNMSGTNGYIYLDEIILSKDKAPQARIEMETMSKSGRIKREYKNVGAGDNLYRLSGEMEQYRGYLVTEICVDATGGAQSHVVFDNGMTLYVKDALGNVSAEQKVRIQIRETIRTHLNKEKELFKRGIKCLSLFFIDEVANYRKYDEDGNQVTGRYGEIFEEEYRKELGELGIRNEELGQLGMRNEELGIRNEELGMGDAYLRYLKGIAAHDTHAGYFSIDKKGRAVNSEVKRGTDLSDDTSAYDLILKDKERLLSLDEPVRFIFSHSALREGWDNPNVFQICSLRQSNSVAQKRQEVGRGLRLCVDANGVRQDSDTIADDVHKVNKLTVIASEGYASFVADLQKDIKQDLYDRPVKADVGFFIGKIVTREDGVKISLTPTEAGKIYLQLNQNGYITPDGEVTDTFREDSKAGRLKPLTGDMQPYTTYVYKQVQSIFDTDALESMISNANKQNTPPNKLNDNFKKKEFQELWKLINHKYAYTVNFDSDELEKKAVKAINEKLEVAKSWYAKTRGEQKESTTHDDIKNGTMMVQEETGTYDVKNSDMGSSVKYDLLGKIGSATKLTRKTVAKILSKIKPEKFDLYKDNPEEFIRNVSRLIMEQKATIIVEHISYNILDGKYDSDIFTQEKHTTLNNAYPGKKSIMDYVFIDSNVEKEFAKNIDTANEVAVYAKLPKGFHIPTPVGNYSPDWAIAFQEGTVKHVYFVAETKGDLSSLGLRGIEDNKIECTKKLFEQLSTANVKYDRVKTFDDLMKLVK